MVCVSWVVLVGGECCGVWGCFLELWFGGVGVLGFFGGLGGGVVGGGLWCLGGGFGVWGLWV